MLAARAAKIQGAFCACDFGVGALPGTYYSQRGVTTKAPTLNVMAGVMSCSAVRVRVRGREERVRVQLRMTT